MGFKIFGIGAAEAPDNKGEIVHIDGMDLSFCARITDEHAPGNSNTIGAITKAEKVLNEKDANTPRKKKCWELAKVPFVYFEGELADDEGHPDAIATAALIKFTANKPTLPFKVNASVEGLTLRRRSRDEKSTEHKHITLSLAEGFSVTCKPCNTKCLVFPYNDLEKSDCDIQIPKETIDKIMFSNIGSVGHNMVEPTQEQMADLKNALSNMYNVLKSIDPEDLKKSLDDWDKGGMATMRCHQCSHTERLFKSSKHWSNRCRHCGAPFSMKDFWQAFNQ